MSHDASDEVARRGQYPKGYAQKLELIDRVINAMVTEQLKEMEAKLKAAQTQTQALDNQYQ